MVISLAFVNGSHHWLVIKWFLPCSTSDHCNHIDRIILCGRRDEDTRYLFKSAHCFSPGCDGVLYIYHGSKFVWSYLHSNLHLYDINIHCPSLSPLSHGSTMYSSSHACLFLSWICLVLVYSHEFGYLCLWVNILMYYRFLLDNLLRSSRHFHLMTTTCSLKALIYRIPIRLMLWGAFYYTQILPPTCDEILNPYVFPKSQTWSGNLLWISILHEKT